MHSRILFIGGAGFIGSNIIRALSKRNDMRFEIHIVEPSLADTTRLDGLNVCIHKGELKDSDFIQNLITSLNINSVVHLVSTLVPGSSREDFAYEYENVIFPTVRLIQFCGKSGIKLIYFSSGGTVYGERNNGIPFVESDTLQPISYYGLSKQIIENCILFEHRTSGLQYLILRPSNPYGHGQNLYGKQGLIAVSLGRIISGQKITVWGDGMSVRDYIHIDDLSNIFCHLVEMDIINETFNIGSGTGHSTNEIISYLKECTGEAISVEYIAARKSDVSNVILNIDKLKSIIPNLLFKSLKEGIKDFYLSEKNA